MTARHRHRGAPLLALVAVLAGWSAGRVATWETPFAVDLLPRIDLPMLASGQRDPLPIIAHPVRTGVASGPGIQPHLAIALTPLQRMSWSPQLSNNPASFRATTHPAQHYAAGHQLLWLAAVAQLTLPDAILQSLNPHHSAPHGSAAHPAAHSERERSRWSFDGWLLLRGGSGLGSSGGGFPASYGASQAGAVLRYRIDRSSTVRPFAYLRASTALGASRQRELAAGLSARPVSGIPARLYAELRLADNGSDVRLRPAVMAVSELPAANLPGGLRGEAYLQAGYVGGDFGTAFVDGQARLDREIARIGSAATAPEVRLGAGAWGGAQRGAARLDIGPSGSVDVRLGEMPARVTADYRHRIAGDAAPASGFALTLSTGF